MSLLRKLFLIREIKSKEGALHFRRWRLLSTPWFSIFIHQIFKGDEDRHCHDHPWSFVTCILKGGYVEYNENSSQWDIENGNGKYCLPSLTTGIRFVKSTKLHTIRLIRNRPTTTLVLAGPRNREWGYGINGGWLDNKTYRKLKNDDWPIQAFNNGDRVLWATDMGCPYQGKQGTITEELYMQEGIRAPMAHVKWDNGVENDTPINFLRIIK